MLYFDTHSHLTLCNHLDYDEHISLCRSNKIEYILDPGIWVDDFDDRYGNLAKYPEVYFGIAMAPHGIGRTNLLEDNNDIKEDDLESLINKLESYLLEKNKFKIKAISEIGLDFYYSQNKKNHQLQEKLLMLQLNLANKHQLPIFLHIREAFKRTFDLVKYSKVKKGAVHCFTGNKDEAKKFLDLGYYLSFSGIVTFKNAKDIQLVAKYAPIDRILTETDSPYLSPHPLRRKKNNSSQLIHINQFLSQLKKIDEKKLNLILYKNSKKILQIN